ncbi:MAG TPA: CBS domain-containing protein [Desulfuromonadales bacterium]|nr:CBS domain-containing protein [Desulfuromonadales bacterium]
MDVITTHIQADFDSLGAMTAALRLYPGAVLAMPGSQEKGVRDFIERHPEYLPHITRAKDIDLASISRLIIVDCQQASRIGRFAEILDRPGLQIHIYDHHPPGDDSIRSDDGATIPLGSASTLLASFLMERATSLTPEEATLILIGIHEDTGRLLFAAATPKDYQMAGWLLSQGAHLHRVAEALTPELNGEQMGLLKQLLATIRTTSVNGIVISIAHASSDRYIAEAASLAHLMRDMGNLDALFVVVAMEEHVYIVARSHAPEVNVGEIMKHFQGGGHATAASATVHNRTLPAVLAQLDELLLISVSAKVSAADIMSSPVKTMPDSVDINAARELLTRYNCSAMPVIADGRVAGIISRKTVEKALYHGLGESSVTDFMHTEFTWAAPDTPLTEILESVTGGDRRFVPVFDGGKLVGALTRTDLLRHISGGHPGERDSLYDVEALNPPVRKRSITNLLERRLSEDVRRLLHDLGTVGDELGLAVYAVGGFVRDLLLGIDNLDIDVTVEGDGIFFAEQVAARYGCRVRSHAKFGTAVLIFADGRKLDVASTRLEYYESPGALPMVERASLRHDLYRRDFSINTLALSINGSRFGYLTDYFNGQTDISERMVRVLHNLSFVEDPTRVFRAIRFEQRLGFRIAPHTEKLIRNAVRMDLLDRLGGERLRNELIQIMNENDPAASINRMSSLGLLPFIHHALKLHPATVQALRETGEVMAWFRLLYLKEHCETWQVWFLGLCDGLHQEEFSETCRRLALPGRLSTQLNRQRHQVARIVRAIKVAGKSSDPLLNSQLHTWFGGLSLEVLLYLAARAGSEQVKRLVSCYLTRLRGVTPLLKGDDLLSLGMNGGPQVGRIMKRLLQARLDGEVVSREDELALARTMITRIGRQGDV